MSRHFVDSAVRVEAAFTRANDVAGDLQSIAIRIKILLSKTTLNCDLHKLNSDGNFLRQNSEVTSYDLDFR